jgi:hypothetical protein
MLKFYYDEDDDDDDGITTAEHDQSARRRQCGLDDHGRRNPPVFEVAADRTTLRPTPRRGATATRCC